MNPIASSETKRHSELACQLVLAKKGRKIDVDALRGHLADKMASFKVPSIIEIALEALPRNASGKILTRDIRDALIERRSA